MAETKHLIWFNWKFIFGRIYSQTWFLNEQNKFQTSSSSELKLTVLWTYETNKLYGIHSILYIYHPKRCPDISDLEIHFFEGTSLVAHIHDKNTLILFDESHIFRQ